MHHLALDSFIYFLIKRADVVGCSELTVAVFGLKIYVLFVWLFWFKFALLSFCVAAGPSSVLGDDFILQHRDWTCSKCGWGALESPKASGAFQVTEKMP